MVLSISNESGSDAEAWPWAVKAQKTKIIPIALTCAYGENNSKRINRV